MPRKVRPRRRKREHRQQHLPGTNGNLPGINLQPRGMKRTPVKHPQHPRPAPNENLSWVDPWNQADPGRLYKQAQRSRGKESIKRSRRDNFYGSSPSFSCKQQDKEKTASRTSSGQLFEFNQVPFGLCNAPATFSSLMDQVLAGLHWETCLFYLDDIIVFAATWEEHLAHLRQVFERLCHAQLKLRAEKCTFAAKEVSYLGHRVTPEGLLPDPTLLAAIRQIGPPRQQRKFAHFWASPGTTGDMSRISPPLPALSTLSPGRMWSSTGVRSVKTPSTASRPSSPPAQSPPSRTSTSRSGYTPTPPSAGLGAILAQVREGKECIICCASRSLNQAEKAYPATKLECLAIVWAVAKFRPYLMSMPFKVYTDHYALQWLKTMRTGSALLHRWSAALEE